MSRTIRKGIVAAQGISIGKAKVLAGGGINIPKYHIDAALTEEELARAKHAVRKAKLEIEAIRQQTAKSLSEDMSIIFETHLMLLMDPLLAKQCSEEISVNKKNAEWAINDTALSMMKNLNAVEDEYLRERIIDVADVSRRLIENLHSGKKTEEELTGEVILFAPNFTPSETALMNRETVKGLVAAQGGQTSHTAIIARARKIPALVGVKNIAAHVKDGDTVILDALDGKLVINPTEEEINEYNVKQDNFAKYQIELTELSVLPPQTSDKHNISIYGNMETPEDAAVLKGHGAMGVGLFRSEFLFMGKTLPSEETQFAAYKQAALAFGELPVTIRTIDIGGDKLFASSAQYRERNPFLGSRAIRFSLQNKQMFRTQIRAVLRASAFGNIRLMFPMIAAVCELRQAKEITYSVMDELKREGVAFNESMPIGIMIEVPSAAINADILAKEADFFSVGTNDLVQYLLAVDRLSEQLAYLYNPLDVAVLRTLSSLSDTAASANIPISICGEMAGASLYTMTLLGLGFTNLSMSASGINPVKKIIRSVTLSECKELATRQIQLADGDAAAALAKEYLRKLRKQ